MKIPLEEYIPYRISTLIVLAVFYGIYLVKQWRQKRRGIRTIQIGRRKDTQTHTVETLMGIATAGIIPAQLLSITFGWSHLSANARFTGFCIGTEVRKATSIPEDIPLFTLQGGFNKSKLKGVDKLMITLLAKGLASQKQRSDQEKRMLELLSKDANYVSTENLAGILQWYTSVFKMGDSDAL